MSDPTPAPRKGLPPSLIFLLVMIAAFCIGIFFFMRHGFHLFNTFKPDTSELGPATPGFP